jgi:hypothetical protein
VCGSWVAGPGPSQEVSGLVGTVSHVRVMATTLLFADLVTLNRPAHDTDTHPAYGDEKAANREIRVWHGATEKGP